MSIGLIPLLIILVVILLGQRLSRAVHSMAAGYYGGAGAMR